MMEEGKKKKGKEKESEGKEKESSDSDDDLHSGLDSFKTVSRLLTKGVIRKLMPPAGTTLCRGYENLSARSDLSVLWRKDR
jgi:hypothetical protein